MCFFTMKNRMFMAGGPSFHANGTYTTDFHSRMFEVAGQRVLRLADFDFPMDRGLCLAGKFIAPSGNNHKNSTELQQLMIVQPYCALLILSPSGVSSIVGISMGASQLDPAGQMTTTLEVAWQITAMVL